MFEVGVVISNLTDFASIAVRSISGVVIAIAVTTSFHYPRRRAGGHRLRVRGQRRVRTREGHT